MSNLKLIMTLYYVYLDPVSRIRRTLMFWNLMVRKMWKIFVIWEMNGSVVLDLLLELRKIKVVKDKLYMNMEVWRT